MGIKHTKVSAVADGSNPTQVRPSDWNDDHTIDGDVDFSGHDITNVGNLGEFTDLADAPATYVGSGNKLVAVNAGATGLTFIAPSAGGPVDEFTDLLDVPGSYSGQAGKVATVNAGETALEFADASTGVGWVTPQMFGAVADGDAHPLSEFYGSLAAAQAAYDNAFFFVTSLTQQIDYVASKAAANECFGPDTISPVGDGFITPGDYLLVGAGTGALDDFSFNINDSEPDLVPNALVGSHTTAFVAYASSPGFVSSAQVASNTTRTVTCSSLITLSDTSMYAFGQGENGDNYTLNKPLYFPQGRYLFGSDTLLIRNLASGRIMGAGKLATTLTADDRVLAFDGVWYTHISDMTIGLTGDTGTVALDIDGNVPSHPYTTRGVQSVTLSNCLLYGANSDYAMAMCRLGGGNAQGSECVYLNCHFQAASLACYLQNGFNALNNTFIGGNFQSYTKNGIEVNAGTVQVFSVGFQSTEPYHMVLNGGYDISINGGSIEGVSVYGCRTESFQFLFSDTGQRVDVRACRQRPAGGFWSASTGYGPNHPNGDSREAITVTNTSTDGANEYAILFYALNDGTSGLVEPTWPTNYGTVVDGTITWQGLPFYFIYSQAGAVDYASVRGQGIYRSPPPTPLLQKQVDYITPKWVGVMTLDATDGNRIYTAPRDMYDDATMGHRFKVKRIDNTANTCTLNIQGLQLIDGTFVNSITLNPGEWREFIRISQPNAGSPMWACIGGSQAWGNRTAIGAETVTGYLTVIDGMGVSRKLAVVS